MIKGEEILKNVEKLYSILGITRYDENFLSVSYMIDDLENYR